MIAVEVKPEFDERSLDRVLGGAGDELRERITRSLMAPAKRINTAQRSRVLTLTGAPSEWKAAAARDLDVDLVLTGARPRVDVTLRPASAGQGAVLDKGEWRHPTFGHDPWVEQRVTPGWFTDPAEAMTPAVIRETEAEWVRAVEDLSAAVRRAVN